MRSANRPLKPTCSSARLGGPAFLRSAILGSGTCSNEILMTRPPVLGSTDPSIGGRMLAIAILGRTTSGREVAICPCRRRQLGDCLWCGLPERLPLIRAARWPRSGPHRIAACLGERFATRGARTDVRPRHVMVRGQMLATCSFAALCGGQRALPRPETVGDALDAPQVCIGRDTAP